MLLCFPFIFFGKVLNEKGLIYFFFLYHDMVKAELKKDESGSGTRCRWGRDQIEATAQAGLEAMSWAEYL